MTGKQGRRLLPKMCVGLAIMLSPACAARGPAPVSPGEIPALQQQLERDPADAASMLRLSAALFADDRCDEALPLVRRARALRSRDALGVLVEGQCLERMGQHADAIEVYEAFLATAPDAPGGAAVRGRSHMAQRALAVVQARRALEDETRLSDAPAEATTVAVLPLLVTGDETYQPLSLGLAALITADLSLLDRFRLVERLQIDALLAELALGESERVDPATSARIGNLVRAGRIIQGTASFESGAARLEASVVADAGGVAVTDAATGPLDRLLSMQKEVVIGLAERLGPPLTMAERTRILDNGTQNLLAFLAYARGLDAERRGAFDAAAAHYGEAVQADPAFTQARQRRTVVVAADVVASAAPEDVTVVAVEADAAVADAQIAVTTGPSGPLANAVSDIASTSMERLTAAVGGPSANHQITQITSTPATDPAPGVERLPIDVIIRILIPIPR